MRAFRFSTLLLVLSAASLAAAGGPPVKVQPSLRIPRLDTPPTVEDFLQMKPGPRMEGRMAKVEEFIQREPKDGAPAQHRTHVYLGYDQENLYAVFVAFDPEAHAIRARLARREEIGSDHDEVQLYLDTFNDQRRAYGFMSNPVGVQFDYIWTETNGYDGSFDTVWNSQGKVTDDGYVVLMSIPFKSLRFPSADDQTWGILLQRVVPHSGENLFWPPVSTSIQGRLNQEGKLDGLSNISAGRNIQIIPYGVFRSFKGLDARDPALPGVDSARARFDGGVDAKFVLKDSLVLDVTVNPDFSQVESDEPQSVVNQRFEVFFPEKRPFFLENASFFETPINLLFTRRIADPRFGVRLTGKLGRNALGVLLVDDQSPGRIVAEHDPNFSKRAHFGVVRVTHELWRQSHLGFIFTDREFRPDLGSSCDALRCLATSNRVGGLDGSFRLNRNWVAKFQAISSTTDTLTGDHFAGPSYFARVEHESRHLIYNAEYNETSAGFRTLPGFFRRTDIRRESQFAAYRFRPEGKVLLWWGPQIDHVLSWDHDGTRLDSLYHLELPFQLQKQTFFSVWHGFWREQLRPSDFDTLDANQDFPKPYTGFFFASNALGAASFRGWMEHGSQINFNPPSGVAPFLADRSLAQLFVTLRPLHALVVDNSYLFSRLRERSSGANIFNNHVLRSKWNYQFTPRLSFRAIFQYDTTLSNPALTSLKNAKNFNADFLVTYLVHPGTAVYVGYNSNLQNLARPVAYDSDGDLLRTRNSFLNDSRGLFVKASYLFRF